MNFFENQWKKIFGTKQPVPDAKCLGMAYYGSLDKYNNFKLQFVTKNTYEKYEGIRASIINKSGGQVDVCTFWFEDVWGRKSVNSPYLKKGVIPYVWKYNEKTEWYAYEPTDSDYKVLADNIQEYLNMFMIQEQSETQGLNAPSM